MNSARRSKIKLSSTKKSQSHKRKNVREDFVGKGETEGTKIQLGLRPFKDQILLLVPHVNTPIVNLPPAKAEIFNRVKDVLNNIFNSKPTANYKVIFDIIEEVFGQYNGPFIPGTVGAYFLGCFKDDNFGGKQGCSASCAGMLQPSGDTVGWETCEYDVVFYKDGSFVQQHVGINSDYVIIHILDENFVAFEPKNINMLNDSGYVKASLYIFSKDQNYTVEQDFVSIDQLPVKARNSVHGGGGHGGGKPVHRYNDVKEENTGYNWILWFIVIIIIIIIIACLVGWGYRRKSMTNTGYSNYKH